MKKWAVGYINFYDNDLIIEIIKADTWYEALFKHSKVSGNGSKLSKDIKTAKGQAFDSD